ncbi:MAG: hypothetical protein AABY07_02715 [Nanoarchaeota archaeon]
MGAIDCGLVESKSVYERMIERRTEIEEIEHAKSFLGEYGFEVSDGNYPIFGEVLEEPEYRDNPIVARLRTGERLEDITDEIVSQGSNNLRFDKTKRVAYNERVKVLNDVVDASELRSYGALSLREYGGPILGSIIGGIFVSGVIAGSVPNLEIPPEILERSISLSGGIGMFIFAFRNYMISDIGIEIRKIKEKARYIDSLLENEIKGYFDNQSESDGRIEK